MEGTFFETQCRRSKQPA